MNLRRSIVALTLGFGVLSMVSTGLLIAAIQFTDFQTATIRTGRTVRGSFASTSAQVEILGNVEGDVAVRAGYARQVGSVGGDMTIAAGRVEVRGPVGGTVTVYAGSVSFYGEVHGDVIVYGGQVTVVEQAVIHGDLTVHGGSVTLVARSELHGDLRGEAARLTLEGTIRGNVDVSAWRLSLSPGASIWGDLRYWSWHQARIADDARVGGNVERIAASDRIPLGAMLLWHTAALPRALALIAIGTFLAIAAPRSLLGPANAMRKDPPSLLLVGLAVAVLVPLALITLGLFIVTLPVVAVLAAIYLAIAYLSSVIVGTALGHAILRRGNLQMHRGPLFLAMILGVSILSATRLVPIPFADIGIATAIAIIGFGGTARWLMNGRLLTVSKTSARLPGAVVGGAVGALVVILAVSAVIGASTGALAAAATLSRSAVFTWEIGPRRLAASALLLAALSFVLAGAVIAVARGGRTDR